jgi:hypothetical protein
MYKNDQSLIINTDKSSLPIISHIIKSDKPSFVPALESLLVLPCTPSWAHFGTAPWALVYQFLQEHGHTIWQEQGDTVYVAFETELFYIPSGHYLA